jgi:hypothetical protein
MYIILYKDGAMIPVANKPQREAHQKDARFFFVSDNFTMLELSEWYASGCPRVKKTNKLTRKEIVEFKK